MVVQRITRIVEVGHLWSFFQEGIKSVVGHFKYTHPLSVYRKIICHLVQENPNAWVGVAFDETKTPVAFVLSHEITPLFATIREFEVSLFYYEPGCKHAIKHLQDALDTFCQENNIQQYYLTTPTVCAGAMRAYTHTWVDLKRSNTVYKRRIPVNAIQSTVLRTSAS